MNARANILQAVDAAVTAAGGAAKVVQKLTPDGVILTRGSDLKATAIDWLWLHWLARGKLGILAGPPGQGKTTIAIDVIATVTSGGRWPDGMRCKPGNALMWSGEDDPADTLVPRTRSYRRSTARRSSRCSSRPQSYAINIVRRVSYRTHF